MSGHRILVPTPRGNPLEACLVHAVESWSTSWQSKKPRASSRNNLGVPQLSYVACRLRRTTLSYGSDRRKWQTLSASWLKSTATAWRSEAVDCCACLDPTAKKPSRLFELTCFTVSHN